MLSADEIRQRRALIDRIKAKDYQQVMEEVAYTWFNRFIALRFLEVNNYLPSRVRVFTDADNRFKPQMDKMAFHKIVRGASRRADIAYEYAGGKVEYDDIEDPLPFDLEAPIVEIGENDYAIWYRDMGEEPKKYENKTVRFKCKALVRSKIPAGSFIVGRHVMTCCADDIQFAGLVCQWDKAATVKDESWLILTARINFAFHKAYTGKGQVLTFVEAQPCQAPDEPVATFY